jgi:hypothetical protein
MASLDSAALQDDYRPKTAKESQLSVSGLHGGIGKSLAEKL